MVTRDNTINRSKTAKDYIVNQHGGWIDKARIADVVGGNRPGHVVHNAKYIMKKQGYRFEEDFGGKRFRVVERGDDSIVPKATKKNKSNMANMAAKQKAAVMQTDNDNDVPGLGEGLVVKLIGIDENDKKYFVLQQTNGARVWIVSTVEINSLV